MTRNKPIFLMAKPVVRKQVEKNLPAPDRWKNCQPVKRSQAVFNGSLAFVNHDYFGHVPGNPKRIQNVFYRYGLSNFNESAVAIQIRIGEILFELSEEFYFDLHVHQPNHRKRTTHQMPMTRRRSNMMSMKDCLRPNPKQSL